MKKDEREHLLAQKVEKVCSAVKEIRFPAGDNLAQDKEWCDVVTQKGSKRIRFHDYHRIFEIPGLYEELFYSKLDCKSPFRIVQLFQDTLEEFEEKMEEVRAIEIGAGNGIVGETLKEYGADSVVGLDIIKEAKAAALRDRPEVYEKYYIVDLTDLPEQVEHELRESKFNCLVVVAAMGFGDIPPEAFIKALDLIETDGWLAYNLKEDFVYQSDRSGFAALIEELTKKQIIQIQTYQRYCHRLSLNGDPLYYVGFIARKLKDIPDELLEL